jgi:hypothetical protein
MKATKISFGLFTGGFLIFSLYKFFSQKRISKEQISKIVRKISNLSIHFMFQRYDSQNKIINQKKEDSSQQILISADNKKNNNNNIINLNELNEEEINNNFEENFDNEVLFVLLQIENEKIKSLEITNEEFQEYILEYKDEDADITKNFNLIQKVLKSFKQRKLPVINFGFIIPEKYLQIISNIFYFNLKNSIQIYYNKLISFSNQNNLSFKEKNQIFNNIYSSNLKNTRNIISSFFGIDKDNNLEINIKLALRIFPFYYDKNHKLRKTYNQINDNVNKLINIILKNDEKIDALINENNKYYIKEPSDIIINFEEIIIEVNSNLKDNKINNVEEIPYEDQYD